MALTNAQRQQRYRDKRNELVEMMEGTPTEIAHKLVFELGVEVGMKVAEAMRKRIRNIKPDCPKCKGQGFCAAKITTACGMPLWESPRVACPCFQDR
jgi:hypothetical protein